ncbi:MAG: hypothetical protein Kow0099_03760 [Candidatus Abyssubacteria bacterium]
MGRQETPVPEEKIVALAAQIEEVVQNTRLEQPKAEEIGIDVQTGEVLSDLEPMSLMIGTDEIRQKVPALAEVGAENEVMLSAIRGRILRRPAVYELEQKGCLGENRQAFVENLGGAECSRDRSEKDRAAFVVWLENRDRRTIHEQVAEAAGLGTRGVSRVRELFAEQAHLKAWAGTPLQMEDGSWKRK